MLFDNRAERKGEKQEMMYLVSEKSRLGLFYCLPVRKEVIQPQVLLQLPCYDFTPIMDHTVGASLPEGLGRRLLVQPTFVM